jgi:group II intron reverse transcriptase/maturase
MQNRETERHIQTVLTGIAHRARLDSQHRFGGLYTLLNEDFLRWCFYQLNRKAAAGVDGTTWKDYECELEANLANLVDRLKRKCYKARLVKRHWIPKGKDKFRPLGIPVLEDKLLQYATKTILESIYEEDFMECSYGYRPGRSAKEASGELCFHLQFAPIGWVVEADIKGFFDNMNHEWILKMLEKRVHDRAFVGLIGKWLKAGVLEDLQTVIHPVTGTPQGGVISPILANLYLHHALDIWFEEVVKKKCDGEVLMIRYADDFVCAFRFKRDAQNFYETMLPQRMARYSLELAPDKTRMVRFSRFAIQNGGKFEFLGFEFRWGRNRALKPQVKRRTSRSKLRKAMAALTSWIKKNRHLGLRPLMATLIRKLRGHYNYYGVTHNSDSLWEYWAHVNRVVFKWLNRRSQRRSFTWEKFNLMFVRYKLPKPYIKEAPSKRRYGKEIARVNAEAVNV